jgi:transposase
MKSIRRRFTHEFKVEAVKLWEDSGRKSHEIGKQLGVAPQMLLRWQQALGRRKTSPKRCPNTQATGSSSDVGADLSIENARLRRENERLILEREILKKTVAFISEITK